MRGEVHFLSFIAHFFIYFYTCIETTNQNINSEKTHQVMFLVELILLRGAHNSLSLFPWMERKGGRNFFSHIFGRKEIRGKKITSLFPHFAFHSIKQKMNT